MSDARDIPGGREKEVLPGSYWDDSMKGIWGLNYSVVHKLIGGHIYWELVGSFEKQQRGRKVLRTVTAWPIN